MAQDRPVQTAGRSRASNLPQRFRDLLHGLLSQASRGVTRLDFLRFASQTLLDFSGCDILEIRVDGEGRTHWCQARTSKDGEILVEYRAPMRGAFPAGMEQVPANPVPEELLKAVQTKSFAAAGQFFTRNGSFWTNDAARPILLHPEGAQDASRAIVVGGEMQSLALMPIPIEEKTQGTLYMASRKRDFFTKDDIQFHEAASETLGVALAHQAAQWALGERVKELTCLYGIARILQRPDAKPDELLVDIVRLLPPGWQYPEITKARITFDGRTCVTDGFCESPFVQSEEILVNGQGRGKIEVFYAESRPDSDEGPFLKEERNLINGVAETVGVALGHRAAQWALGERVKEIMCLYGIARVLQQPALKLEELLEDIVRLLPPGWQYPQITKARITFDGRACVTDGFCESPFVQSEEILVNGQGRGKIEVFYAEPRPESDEGPFLKEERSLINGVAETLGVALGHRAAQSALGERVKELTCLYGIAKAFQRQGCSLEDILLEIAGLLPSGWQYPAVTKARIILDGKTYATPGFVEGPSNLWATFCVDEVERGRVEVVYTEPRPASDEGPFLKEERSLIDGVARQVGLIIESREAEEEKIRLQEQLRHADRLATIGQLSAGAAHELNEPLGSILGFAQLAKDCPGLPKQAEQDMDRIVNAALHAREVIKKLMLFARQVPTRKSPVSLNKLVRDGLYFIESRCAKESIRIVKNLDDNLPEITADPSQMHQVLVNLVVNAVQAMPGGGTLTIGTRAAGPTVSLTVEDTGTGMSEEILKQLFLPFFTTKEVGQGTGLGLSVVHGIVTSHGGKISVESRVGTGSRFTVSLPVRAAAEGEEIS